MCAHRVTVAVVVVKPDASVVVRVNEALGTVVVGAVWVVSRVLERTVREVDVEVSVNSSTAFRVLVVSTVIAGGVLVTITVRVSAPTVAVNWVDVRVLAAGCER